MVTKVFLAACLLPACRGHERLERLVAGRAVHESEECAMSLERDQDEEQDLDLDSELATCCTLAKHIACRSPIKLSPENR
uniref:HDC03018 n=1 Tax=Drosophila melanogaster TaxID=7227 RepID=Q6IH85_DROME|nr:TPA_inf: HDC03018 [Drosophila melanogaster]